MSSEHKILEQVTGETVAVKSQALKPALWLFGLSAAAAAVAFRSESLAWCWITGGLVVISFLMNVLAYGYFAIKDPDRLGSEAFVLKQHALRYMEQQGDKGPIEITAADLVTPNALNAKPDEVDRG